MDSRVALDIARLLAGSRVYAAVTPDRRQVYRLELRASIASIKGSGDVKRFNTFCGIVHLLLPFGGN